MELRRDPVSGNWVIQEDGGVTWATNGSCPFCPGQEDLSPLTIYSHANGEGDWQVRVTPHLRPLYRIEEAPQRRAEGMYDKMRCVGAHEVVVETPDHQTTLSRLTDEGVAQVLRAYASRISDLKKDSRFRYVAVFRDQGILAGQELEHPHSEITATPFIPRRVVYELRSHQLHYAHKERCLLCDMASQETAEGVRTVERNDQFIAFCPFASRTPYETWILPTHHHSTFEEDLSKWDRQVQFASFLKSTLRRVESVQPSFHLVLHTTPNLNAKFESKEYWRTVEDDFHWHFEILPASVPKSTSYSLKEVFYNSLRSEQAAAELRKASERHG